KSGVSAPALTATQEGDAVVWSGDDGVRVRVVASPAPGTVDRGRLRWPVALEPGDRFDVTLTVTMQGGPGPVVLPAAPALHLDDVRVVSGDGRLGALVERSLADLDALTAADPLAAADRFLAAGAPWFLTLFGCDAIWAARMLLPLGTDLAAGTLRALARRQGTEVDPASAQQPG